MGSDWPVTSPDPLAAIHTAVTRTSYGEEGPAGAEPFLPEQALDLEHRLRGVHLGHRVGERSRPHRRGRGARPGPRCRPRRPRPRPVRRAAGGDRRRPRGLDLGRGALGVPPAVGTGSARLDVRDRPNMVRMDPKVRPWRNPSICATRSTESAATPVRVPPMADQHVPATSSTGSSSTAVSGETYDVIDPTTGEVYAPAPMSGAEDVDRAYAAAAAAFEAWGETTPQDRATRAAQDRRRDRVARRRDQRGRVQGHRQAARTDDVGGDAVRLRPLPLLRRRRARARGPVRRRVHGGPHLVDPPRAGRRRRPGDAVELPAADDDLEDRPGARRPATPSSSSPATPPPPARRCSAELCQEFLPPGVLNVVCGDRDTGRALVAHKTPQMVAITGSVRAGMEVADSAAADLKRVHLELGGKAPVIVFDDADIEKAAEGIAVAGLLQRRPGLHRRHPGAGRTRRPRRLRRGAHRAGQGHEDRAARRRGRATTARSTTQNQLDRVSGMVDRLPDHADLETGGRRQGTVGLLLRADRALRPAAGRRADPAARSSAR